jgi:hypothetical protein
MSGSFRWPTYFKFGHKNSKLEDFWDAVTMPSHYNRSEFNAWRSSAPLRQLLGRLNWRYPGRVYPFSHSMGVAVAGEALRLAGNEQIVNTFVANQGAIAAHVYDGSLNAPGALLNFLYDHPFELIGLMNYGPATPTIYGDLHAGNNAAAARRVNFYNPNDWALAHDKWGWNQLLKPSVIDRIYLFDGFPYDGEQSYSPGSPDDDPPWDHFRYMTLGGSDPLPIAEKRYEIMAFAAEARSRPLGVMANVGGLPDPLDLRTIWPPDPNPDPANGAYGAHKWHSPQFRSTNMRQQGYWRALLDNRGFGLQ